MSYYLSQFRALKPGDQGWIGRARVPMPSNKDYVVRPKWNVEMEFVKVSMKLVKYVNKHATLHFATPLNFL